MAEINRLNQFYNYLKKRKTPEDKLEAIGVLYKNRSLDEKECINTNEELYKCLKYLVAFMNKVENEFYVYDKKKNCKFLFEVTRIKFDNISKLKYRSLDTIDCSLFDCYSFINAWRMLYCNLALMSFEDKEQKKGGFKVFDLEDVLQGFLFSKNNIDTACDEIKVYLELIKNE